MFTCRKSTDAGASEQRLRLVDEGKLVELQLDGRAFDEDVSGPIQGRASRGASIKS